MAHSGLPWVATAAVNATQPKGPTTMAAPAKPVVSLQVFSDYICPFCYIGALRLERLQDEFDLRVDWRLLELHPDNSPSMQSVSTLGYAPQQWQAMMAQLQIMAREEGVELQPHAVTTNSNQALRLAEAIREREPERFAELHLALFVAFLVDGRNIGDPAVLVDIATGCGISPETVHQAWNENRYQLQLEENLAAAVARDVTGTPTFFIGARKLVGALPLDHLRAAARGAMGSDSIDP